MTTAGTLAGPAYGPGSPVRSRKLVCFLPSLGGGGAERVVLNVATALARRGYSVDLVLGSPKGAYMDQLSCELDVVSLKCRKMVFGVLPLVRYLMRRRPDVLMSTSEVANIVAVVATRWAPGRPVRTVLRQANTFSATRSAATGARRLVFPLLKRALRRADAVVTVSSGVAADLTRHVLRADQDAWSIPNPAFREQIVKDAALPATHAWLQDDVSPVVLAVGRLVPEKDYPTLLAAFARVVQARRARLLILGDGRERDGLTALARRLRIAEVVDMPGFQRNPYAYMARAHVFVLSSRSEGMPNVLVEAMACGTPVVSTDCPHGPREVLADGKWGKLVPVGDSEAMAAAILQTLDEVPDRESLGARARCFSLERAVDAYERVLFPDAAELAKVNSLQPPPDDSTSRSTRKPRSRKKDATSSAPATSNG